MTDHELVPAEVVSDLNDLSDVSLADVAEALTDCTTPDTVRRVESTDGSRLLVAAAFNSAI